MPAGVSVRSNLLRNCLDDLKPLFGKGNNLMPVLFKVQGPTLTICCTSGCVYTNRLPVMNNDGTSNEMTIQYKHIVDFIPRDATIVLEFQPFGVTLSGPGTSITLPVGYSLITEPEKRNVTFKLIEGQAYTVGLSSLLNVGLPSIYKVEHPISIYKNVAVLKYPNIVLQARTPGFPLNVAMTQDYIKLFNKFGAQEIYTNDLDTIILKRDNACLEIPAEPLHDENNFMQFLSGMSEHVLLDIEGYAEKIRNMSLLGNNIRARITFFEKGIRCTVDQQNITIVTDLGVCEEMPTKVMYLPLQLYLAMIKSLGNNKVEFLYGKETICLRNSSLVMVARAIV